MGAKAQARHYYVAIVSDEFTSHIASILRKNDWI